MDGYVAMIDDLFHLAPWQHQRQGVEDTIAALSNGDSAVCFTSPTGSGKTACMIALSRWAVDAGQRVVILTNRILLTEQTRRVFQNAGVEIGVVSASMPHYEYEDSPVQIASTQTILSRRRKDLTYWLDADLVLVDELHQQSNGESAELLQQYRERGAKLCGVTATPLGVSGVCDKLVIAAGTRELQIAGILCSAVWCVGAELDTRKLVGRKADLSLSETDARKTWGPLKGDDGVRTQIVGHIIEEFERFHPRKVHTLAFAPGVPESLWAARYCSSRGIRSLHVDGQDFWCDNIMRDRKQDETIFREYMSQWREGAIQILWNRFVMREGIDEPQIECILLATPVGSYRSFLQMVGRGLRVSTETPRQMTVIDFGGNWWRHGSPNVNVDWQDTFDCDPDTPSKNRITKLRLGEDPDTFMGRACPKCGKVQKKRARLIYCQYCGHEIFIGKSSRAIIQADGKLTVVNGSPVPPWRIKAAPGNEQIWAGIYWNAVKNKGGQLTFNQLYQQFGYKTAVEAGTKTKPAFHRAYYPTRDLALMPQNQNDWHRLVADVPKEKLH